MRLHIIPCTLLTLVLLLSTLVPAARSAQIQQSWQADPALATAVDAASLSRWLAQGEPRTEAAGQPALPLTALSVAIPSGHKVVALRLVNPMGDTIALDAPLPAGEGILNSDGEAAAAAVSPAERFPADHLVHFDSAYYRGYAIAQIILAPLLYENGAQGPQLHRLLACDLVIETAPDDHALIPLRQRPDDALKSRAIMAARVANPQDLPAMAPAAQVQDDRGPFEPRGMPSTEGSGVDMVIICAAEHAQTFQDLADTKTDLGLTTVVRDLSWIQANYPQGADLAETLRIFLQDAYVKWGISYALLAGDVSIIPTRHVLSYFKSPPELIPTDLYFAELDGNWNADGDAYFGEAAFGNDPGDLVDMVADIHVGRIPVRDAASAQLLVGKILAYMLAPDPSYVKNMSYFGEVLFPADWELGDPDSEITRNGANYCEEVYHDYQLPLAPQLNAIRFYETYWLYPGSVPLVLQDVLSDLNNRAHIVHHVGHGFRYTMSVGSGSIVVAQALALQNGLDHLFSLYAVDCTSGAIDYQCLLEAFLLAPAGGAITCIGTMREAFPTISVYYQNKYYEHFFQDESSIGEAFTASHNYYSANGSVEGAHRWTQLCYVLLGDPSLNIWMNTPGTVAVSLTAPYDLDSDTLRLAVTAGGQPVANARVMGYKASEDRATGWTNALGQIALPINAESPGMLNLSVVARNKLPYQSSINVSSGDGPRLSVDRLRIIDDPAADHAILGNDNGLLDAGEIVRMGFTVFNWGDAPANNLSLELSLPNDEFFPLQYSYPTLTNLSPHDSLALNLVFLMDIPENLVDRKPILFDYALHFTGGVQHDQLDVLGHTPLPALFSFNVEDPAGDNDGQPDANENYTLKPVWKNYGSTPVIGWHAQLTAIDPAGQVFSGNATLPPLNLLERGPSAGFFMRETNVSTPNRFLLTLLGPLGESVKDTIVVRRPDPPGALDLDASAASTVIEMRWERPVVNSPAGYLVYRSLSSGGPYTLASTEPTQHAYFRNENLLQMTRYYFVVEALSADGYRSAYSPQGSISTNPAQLPGFPQETAASSASSVAVGDIDGDGGKELVAASKYIYAWHSDGVEVVDGDHDAATYGVLNPEGQDFVGSVTLAQVDPLTPGLEIIASGLTPPRLYVFHGDGSYVTGWPKTLPDWCWATPAAGDVDGDDLVEIFVVSKNGSMYAFNNDGTEVVNGDNNPNTDGVFANNLNIWSRSSPSLCQLDGDPYLEIVVGSTHPHKVFAWNHDATTLAGWPVTFSSEIYSSPAVGDLDNDGDNEVVVLCENDSLYALTNTGQIVRNGFPVYLTSNAGTGLAPSPAITDFEGDGQLEIVANGTVATNSMDVTVLNNHGNALPGWPKHLIDFSESSPVVADLDGDHQLEILLGTETGYLYGWNQDGSTLPGFPILTEGELRSSPTVGDLDGDGSVDVSIIGWDTTVYAWDLPSLYDPDMPQWRMFRGNPARTGVFLGEGPNSTAESPVLPTGGRLLPNYPNPFNPRTEIRFVTPQGSAVVPVSLMIHDVQGRRVRMLFAGDLLPGSVQSRVWDGTDDSGQAVASGVYFSRIVMGNAVFSRKMVLLK